jgi:ribosomal protein S6--L-glutamate ligase
MEAGEMRGHEMHFLNIKECYMRLDAETPETYRGNHFKSI